MPKNCEKASVTSRGRITLPKRIGQALSVTAQDKVKFDLRDGEVIVPQAEHHDQAVQALLERIAEDVRNRRHLGALPAVLAEAMLDSLEHAPDADEFIAGDVTL